MAGQNIFNSVKLSKPRSSVFDLSHDVKLSFNMGQLVPTIALECVPGDRFNIGCDSLLRLAPTISPFMHRVDTYMHYWFVPNRLLWPNWDKFITNTPDPTELPAFPTLEITDEMRNNPAMGMLLDYFGIPPVATGAPAGVSEIISALPFAAYQLIYHEYYRDQNLHTDVFNEWQPLDDGNNNGAAGFYLNMRNRCWEHDYFTAALPWAQKGGTVEIPLGGFQDVNVYRNIAGPGTTILDDVSGANDDVDVTHLATTNGPGAPEISAAGLYAKTSDMVLDNTSITDLRRAFKLQEWLEKAARGGSRYVENILSFFGVKSPDARLQRPEYITGTKSPVVVSEVLNTTGTPSQPQGDMAGHAVSVTQGRYGGYFCQEHGYIIGICSVMPKTAYMQGIPKHFLKTDPFEFYWPQFAHIGEQPIQNRELYAWQNPIPGSETFGYIPRYAEYKYMANRVAGDFRTTLAHWHMARNFATPPQLNAAFVTSDPTHRIFAVEDPTTQKLWCQILHKIRAIRPMPKFGTPTF